ncbi:glutathione transferase [Salmonella enterica subsp. enterica serovar Typhi]|nr:glutathione transferase [Salmonella enterica subsp. enterica serovar Typhi]
MIFTGWQKGHGMKLIGSYTSPFVRKISVLLLEKGITFEFNLLMNYLTRRITAWRNTTLWVRCQRW